MRFSGQVAVDMTDADADAVAVAATGTAAALGKIDILVTSAGITGQGGGFPVQPTVAD